MKDFIFYSCLGRIYAYVSTLLQTKLFPAAMAQALPPHRHPKTQSQPSDQLLQPPIIMLAESDLRSILQQLRKPNAASHHSQTTTLLSKAKLALLSLNALVPTPTTSPHLLAAAREVLELGALYSIRLQQPEAFTRYFQQLQPFYELPQSSFGAKDDKSQRSKITGLYLLLLLTKGDYAGFHTVLEGLEVEAGSESARGELEKDAYIQYPVKLEQWLMEGSYDRVWGATKRDGVPSEEFGVFSQVRYQLEFPVETVGAGFHVVLVAETR